MNNNETKTVNWKEITIALVVGIIIITLSYYGSNWLLFDEHHQQQALLNSQLTKLHSENDSLENVRNNFTKLSLESSKAQDQYKQLKSLIPEEKDVTKILDWVAEDAHGRNLKLEHFSQNARVNKESLTEVPLVVTVHGDVDQIRRFTEDMARYERLLRVDTVKLEGQLPSKAPQLIQSTDPNKPIEIKLQSDGIMSGTLNITAFVGSKLAQDSSSKP